MTAERSPRRILELGMGFWGAKALLEAVDLGLFTALGKGPLAAGELAARLGLHPRGVRDFLDALVALGLLERRGDRYENSADSSLYLDRGRPTYIGALLEMANARLYPIWGRLGQALRTGRPQNELGEQGGDAFAALYSDPARLELFARAMTGISMPTAMTLAERFPWTDHRSFADVGCAQGVVPVALARTHRHLTGIGFDLPPVAPVFEAYVREQGLADRLRFVAGDFFKDPLPASDVLIFGHILHGFDLERKRELLQRAHAALPAGGAVIVYEALIDDERRANAFGLLMSLNMLLETEGGFDFTGEDCRGWMQEAGFHSIRVEHLVGPDSMVVGLK